MAEEVRPCLRCDGLVSAETFHCPACGALAGVALPGGAPPAPDARARPLLAEAVVLTAAAAVAGGTLFALIR